MFLRGLDARPPARRIAESSDAEAEETTEQESDESKPQRSGADVLVIVLAEFVRV